MMNIGKMMQQATRMQNDMKAMQERLKQTVFAVEKNGVAVDMLGNGEVQKLTIAPTLIDPNDKETLEDVIVAALNQARAKMEEAIAAETQTIMGGLKLPPGFQLPF